MAMDICEKYLIMVTGENNNKIYRMVPNKDGATWTAEYGRVGQSLASVTYPNSQFEKKYKEKVKKGYVDQTDLVKEELEEEEEEGDGYKPIDNKVIAAIVKKLQDMANRAIKQNYTISATKVTIAMVDEAQAIIDSLIQIKDVKVFNDTLLKLFMTIPRSMGQVKNHLAKTDSEFATILQREQDLLDVMRGQVVQKAPVVKKTTTDEEPTETILEANGLIFEECTAEDIARIKVALGESHHKLNKAWRVTNIETQKKFDEYVKENNITDTKLLFHGSRNENWWSIINSGLILRPTNAIITGKMFGYGLYFAPRARKSIGYTSLSGSYWAGGNSNIGYMALQEVAYGKPYDVHSFDSKYYSFDHKALEKACPGANCLHAHAGTMLMNDEIVIYRQEQTTIKYLIEIKN